MQFETNLLDRIARIRLLAFDIDGTLTDGGIFLSADGETKRFDVHDGAGIALAIKAGLRVAFITGRASDAVSRRAAELGVTEVHQGVKNKIAVLSEIVAREGLSLDEVFYMGDDLPDLPAFSVVGLSAAPANATTEIKRHAHYIAREKGGYGAAREVIEIILRNQGRWDGLVAEMMKQAEGLAQ